MREPALLAGFVAEMVHRFGCDRGRVYVAGLSAGVAMADTLGYVADAKGTSAHAAAHYGPWVGTVTKGRVACGHEITVTNARDSAGKPRVETWIVHGAGSAWFGRNSHGTYTDAGGPDATAEMLRFFRSLA